MRQIKLNNYQPTKILQYEHKNREKFVTNFNYIYCYHRLTTYHQSTHTEWLCKAALKLLNNWQLQKLEKPVTKNRKLRIGLNLLHPQLPQTVRLWTFSNTENTHSSLSVPPSGAFVISSFCPLDPFFNTAAVLHTHIIIQGKTNCSPSPFSKMCFQRRRDAHALFRSPKNTAKTRGKKIKTSISHLLFRHDGAPATQIYSLCTVLLYLYINWCTKNGFVSEIYSINEIE